MVVALTFVGVLALLLRHWRATSDTELAVIALTPWLMLVPVLGLVVGLLTRRKVATVLAAVVVVGCVATQLPHFLAEDAPSDATTITVMTLNVRLGRADAAQIVDTVRSQHVDVLMLEELTLTSLHRLKAAGLERALPHGWGQVGASAEGTALWTRLPLHHAKLSLFLTFWSVTGDVVVPGVAHPVRVVAVHPMGPLNPRSAWKHDIARVPALLREQPAGPAVVAGDFNATADSPWFRDILAVPGWANAIDQAGSGPIFTYNATCVPVIGIDHVLTRGAVATGVRPVSIDGTDHRGIIATIAVPRS